MLVDQLKFPRPLPCRRWNDMAPFLRPEAILLTEPEIDEEVRSVMSLIPSSLQAQADDFPKACSNACLKPNFWTSSTIQHFRTLQPVTGQGQQILDRCLPFRGRGPLWPKNRTTTLSASLCAPCFVFQLMAQGPVLCGSATPDAKGTHPRLVAAEKQINCLTTQHMSRRRSRTV